MKNARVLNARVLVALILLLSSLQIGWAGIQLDYSHDTFFNAGGAGTVNATAKAALEAAVADINAVLDLSSFGAITASDDLIVGSKDGTSASFNFSASYTNPSDGTQVNLSSIELAAQEIRIYVGMRNLTGNTLGQGGLGSIGFNTGVSTFGSDPIGDWSDAVSNASTASNAVYSRGDGPRVGNFSGTRELTSSGMVVASGAYDIDLGVTHGNLWFDSDTDNNGVADTLADLDADWHFDHTTNVTGGKNDFYSVALHETLHAIGFGSSDSWDDLVSGTDWTGAEAIAANSNSGAGLIDGGGAHLASTVTSTRISDGMSQAPVMSPSITTGTRKYLTDLDVAVLRDIGFSTVSAVPEPSSFALLALVGGVVATRRRRR